MFSSFETQQGGLSDGYGREETASQNCEDKPTPRPAVKGHQRREVCEGHGDGVSLKRAAAEESCSEGPALASPLLCSLELLISSPSGTQFHVCFRRGWRLLTLAFCESVRCHGDHHLDNASEQGLVKWASRTHSRIHFGAGRPPVKSTAMSLLGWHLWWVVARLPRAF